MDGQQNIEILPCFLFFYCWRTYRVTYSNYFLFW